MKKFALTLMSTSAVFFAGSAIANPNLAPPSTLINPYAPVAGETSFDFTLKGYVMGLRMIKGRYKGHFDDKSYQVYSDLKTSGLGAVLKKLRIWSVTNGKYDRSGLYPVSHTQQNQDKKNRRVEMRYDYGKNAVSVDINPRLGSQGVPPASPQERFSADDVMSGILNIMMREYKLDDKFCDGKVRIFDSKQHYYLRMQPAGGKKLKYKGEKVETLGCHLYYEPINGFDPEDLPSEEEASAPIKTYFAKDDTVGLYVPVQFAYKISGFSAKIKLKDVVIRKG